MISFLTLQDCHWSELVSRWRHLDSSGAPSIWVSDHLYNQRKPGNSWFDGWSSLAALACTTQRARVGMLVSSPALHKPETLAKKVTTIDHMSAGRLIVGLGAGGSLLDETLIGTNERTAGQRLVRLTRFVERLDQLLTDNHAIPSSGSPALRPRPIQLPRPPFTIAGRSQTALRLAALYGQRWNFYNTEALFDVERGLLVARTLGHRLGEECIRIGRDPSEITRSLLFGNAPLAGGQLKTASAVRELAAKYFRAGIDELIFFYPLSINFPYIADEDGLLDTLVST